MHYYYFSFSQCSLHYIKKRKHQKAYTLFLNFFSLHIWKLPSDMNFLLSEELSLTFQLPSPSGNKFTQLLFFWKIVLFSYWEIFSPSIYTWTDHIFFNTYKEVGQLPLVCMLLTGTQPLFYFYSSVCNVSSTTSHCFYDFMFVHNFNNFSYNMPWFCFLFIFSVRSFLSFVSPLISNFSKKLRKAAIISSLSLFLSPPPPPSGIESHLC